ncbi:MAG: DUF2089 domain-containing protein [Pseudomonadota bacterium]
MDWRKLTQLTQGQDFAVERVRTVDDGIAIEGDFALPPLARLNADDQAFVAAFVHCHGSIKQMERWFGVSYPTIKGRLNRIAERLDFAEVREGAEVKQGAGAAEGPGAMEGRAPAEPADVLDRLERGEISAEQALAALTR